MLQIWRVCPITGKEFPVDHGSRSDKKALLKLVRELKEKRTNPKTDDDYVLRNGTAPIFA